MAVREDDSLCYLWCDWKLKLSLEKITKMLHPPSWRVNSRQILRLPTYVCAWSVQEAIYYVQIAVIGVSKKLGEIELALETLCSQYLKSFEILAQSCSDTIYCALICIHMSIRVSTLLRGLDAESLLYVSFPFLCHIWGYAIPDSSLSL